MEKDAPQRSALEARVIALQAEHAADWLGPLQEKGVRWSFRRGLLHLEVLAKKFMSRRWAELGATEAFAWVEGVRLSGWAAREVPRLADCSLLARVKELELDAWSLGPRFVNALAASPYVTQLATLDFRCALLRADDIQILASSPHLGRLSHLRLDSSRLGDDGLAALFAPPSLLRPVRLSLRVNQVGATGTRALSASPHAASLTDLDLFGNHLGDEGARALAGSPYLARLARLNVRDNEIGEAGVTALALSPHLKSLTRLELDNNKIWAARAEEAVRRRFGESTPD